MKRKTVPTSPASSLEDQALEKIYREDLKEITRPRSQMNVFLSWLMTVVLAIVAGASGYLLIAQFGNRWSVTKNLLPKTVGEVAREVVIREVEKTDGDHVLSEEIRQDVGSTLVTLFPKELARPGSLSEIYTNFDARGWGVVLTSDGWGIAPSTVFQPVDYVALFPNGDLIAVTNRVEDPVSGMTYFQMETEDLSVAKFYSGKDSSLTNTSVWAAWRLPSDSDLTLSRVAIQQTAFQNLQTDVDYLRSSESLDEYYQLDRVLGGDPVGAPVLTQDGEIAGVLDRSVSELGVVWVVRKAKDWNAHISDVLKDGTVSRPWLGVRYLDLSESAGISPRSDKKSVGAYITDDPATKTKGVTPGSPAETAEIKKGDVIVKVDDQALDSDHSLVEVIQSQQPGDEVQLEILRGKATLTLPVTLGTIK